MKNEFRCFLKVVLIGIVAGQGFPNRPFIGGPPPPPPIPYYGNREFYPANPMPAFPKPHPPPPLIYRDEGHQPPAFLYREGIGRQPVPPFYQNNVIPPSHSLYPEEGMQPAPPYYHEESAQSGPNLCREGGIPPCPPLYHEPDFRPVAGGTYEEEPGPYQEEGIRGDYPIYHDEYQTVYETETRQPEPCPPEPEKPTRPTPVNSTPKPSRCTPLKGGNSDCQPPLKMNMEPSKENFNTLRTALRMPIEVPASISPKDQYVPTIIIQETIPLHTSVQQEDNKSYSEDDYVDNAGEEGTHVLSEPTLINYPYQFFEPVKICDNNGKLEPVPASKNCLSDVTKIIPVLRAPITLLPSRFPPRIEQIIERIQTYFSTYNHIGNQKPATNSTTTHNHNTSTSTTAPTTLPNTLSTVAGTTMETFRPETTTLRVTTKQPASKPEEQTSGETATVPTKHLMSHVASENFTKGSSGVAASKNDDCDDCKNDAKTDCDDCQEKTTVTAATTTVKTKADISKQTKDCDDCKENETETSKKADGCDDCKENQTETSKKTDGCDDCEKE